MPIFNIGINRAATLADLLYSSDCVTLHCGLRPAPSVQQGQTLAEDNTHLICERTIRMMRPGIH